MVFSHREQLGSRVCSILTNYGQSERLLFHLCCDLQLQNLDTVKCVLVDARVKYHHYYNVCLFFVLWVHQSFNSLL